MGAFDELNDELGIGYGLRGDFGFAGLSTYKQKVGGLSLFIGPEVPVSFQFSRYLRLYAKGAIMNVWNDKVFNGLATELNVDLHLIPLSWIMVGAGVGFNSAYTYWEFEGETQRFGSSAAYFHFYLATSFGSCQNYN